MTFPSVFYPHPHAMQEGQDILTICTTLCSNGKIVCSVQILESAAKAVVTTIISSIPFIGGFLSGIIGLFWGGGGQPSIWDQVDLKLLHQYIFCA